MDETDSAEGQTDGWEKLYSHLGPVEAASVEALLGVAGIPVWSRDEGFGRTSGQRLAVTLHVPASRLDEARELVRETQGEPLGDGMLSVTGIPSPWTGPKAKWLYRLVAAVTLGSALIALFA